MLKIDKQKYELLFVILIIESFNDT